MRIVLDIEANGLNPTDVWCVVTRDIDNDEVRLFSGEALQKEFPVWISGADQIIGHNCLEYDIPVLRRLLGCNIPDEVVYDTLVVGRVLDSGRADGHSLESYGQLLKHPKTEHNDWSKFSPEMLEYCKNDVELNLKLYRYFDRIISRNREAFRKAIECEHRIQCMCLEMSRNGFVFDIHGLEELDASLAASISELDEKIKGSFPDKVEIIQLKTKTKEKVTPFNPRSVRQIVERLHEAGWKPYERTKTYITKKRNREKISETLDTYGWKVNEANLSTLPEDAPEGCKYLIEHILLSARRRTLAEWRAAFVNSTGRIHGRYNPLGTVTQRCSHSNPNMGNIATKKTIKYNSQRLRTLATDLGGRMRSFWLAPEGGWLVGFNLEATNVTCTHQHTMSIIRSGQRESAGLEPSTETWKRIAVYDPSMASLLQTTTEWLQSKNVNVSSVVKKNHWWSIIVIEQGELEDCYADTVIRALGGSKVSNWSYSLTSENKKFNEGFLVGTDMESAHLRIFAHLIDDKEFTQSLISGKKEDGTDPHSVNKRRLGILCPDRDRAKTFIFSFLNGAGASKVAEIFGCSLPEATEVLDAYVKAYPGLEKLKQEVIPRDAQRGYFVGIDGRLVKADSEHKMIGMYLQNMESVLMKYAWIDWYDELCKGRMDVRPVNWVHDEWVTECLGDEGLAHQVGKRQSESIRRTGERFSLRCPMGGEYKVGKNWLEVH